MSLALVRGHAVAWVVAPLILIIPSAESAPLIPSAETASDMTLSARIVGEEGTYQLLNSEIRTGIGTTTDAVAVSLASRTPVPEGSVNLHSAFAESSGSIGLDLSSDGMIKNAGVIATLNSRHRTRAAATATELLFSRARASSQSWVSDLNLRNIAEASAASSLVFTWGNLNTLSLSTQPASAFAYLQDTLTLFQQAKGQSPFTTTVGFTLASENGRVKMELLEAPGATFSVTANGFSFSIPLLSISKDQDITISFQNLHTELSYEAPPRATLQVGEKAGYSGTGSSPPALLNWDKENNRLTFERLPINSLAHLGTDGIEQKYSGDPLEGGFLEIDPLVRFMSLDGREYFSGETENSQIRLLDRQEKVLFSATLPTLVFEDNVLDQGFNLFAPILDVLEADTSHSPWLQDYFTRLGAESTIIPELFVGFDIANTASSNPWGSSFNIPVRAALSFSGVLTVPEISRAAASTALALLAGGLLLVGERSRRARQLEVKVSTSSLVYL